MMVLLFVLVEDDGEKFDGAGSEIGSFISSSSDDKSSDGASESDIVG